MAFNKKDFIFFALSNLVLFDIFCFLAVLSKYGNIFNLIRHDIVEHIFAGISFSALFTAIFSFLILVPTSEFIEIKKQELKTISTYIVLSLLGVITSLIKTIWWELFSSKNTFNHFNYDFIGIVIYIMILSYWFIKNKNKNKNRR